MKQDKQLLMIMKSPIQPFDYLVRQMTLRVKVIIDSSENTNKIEDWTTRTHLTISLQII